MSIKYLALLHDAADWRAERQAGRQAGGQAGRPISRATVLTLASQYARVRYVCIGLVCPRGKILSLWCSQV